MKFQVENIIVDDKLINLSQPIYGDDNTYSLLVGKNACGKTKVLSKLSNCYIFAKDYFSPTEDCAVSYNSQRMPSQVIAVSNSRFDRFPGPEKIRLSRSNPDVEYHYLGLAGMRSSPHGILAKACIPIIDGLAFNRGNAEVIARILDYIGFLPSFNIDLKITYPARNIGELNLNSIYDEFSKSGYLRRNFDSKSFDFERDLLPGLMYLSDRISSNKNLSLHINLMSDWWDRNDFHEFSKYAPNLIESGLLRVSKFSLFDKNTKDKLPLHLASSGQQCMLLMFFGIAGLIKDKSLICIDEPEISLHPRWQSEFIGILQDAFSTYRGCHFVIATHSPQIVSGLTSNNGFVVDLERQELLVSEDYAKRSSDFQLTQVFHEPGFKNEYLLRTLLVILSKLTKSEKLSSEDWIKLSRAEMVKDRLDDADPVLHLLEQIKMLAGAE